jgi:hypothetical protein
MAHTHHQDTKTYIVEPLITDTDNYLAAIRAGMLIRFLRMVAPVALAGPPKARDEQGSW